MIFEIDNIELSFGEQKLLNGIYLKAETGKITGILGSNGCGKSSLLNIIFGNLRPHSKLIRLDGKPVLKPLFRTGLVGYLPQQNYIPKNFRLKKVFYFFNLDLKTFIQHFPQFSENENAKLSTFSGGQRRVIETYIIVGSHFKLILLDEPFTHLAPIYVKKFQELLRIEKQNKAIIITDHLYHHILELTSDLYLLKNACTIPIENKQQLENYHYL